MPDPGAKVTHTTPRKQALANSDSSKFDGAIPYDPAAGTPSSETGGTYNDSANQAKTGGPGPRPGVAPFVLR